MKGLELFVSTEGEPRGEPSIVSRRYRRDGGVGQPRAAVVDLVCYYTLARGAENFGHSVV